MVAVGVGPENNDLADRPDQREKLRKCLTYGREFLSVKAGNRVCRRRRSRAEYRSS